MSSSPSANNLHLGTLAEIRFVGQAVSCGYNVSIPFSQDSNYDCIVDVGDKLIRVQVKSTQTQTKYSYKFNTNKSRKPRAYKSNEVDYFAFYAADIDCFWIIPMDHIPKQTTLRINPNSEKYIKYMNDFSFNTN